MLWSAWPPRTSGGTSTTRYVRSRSQSRHVVANASETTARSAALPFKTQPHSLRFHKATSFQPRAFSKGAQLCASSEGEHPQKH